MMRLDLEIPELLSDCQYGDIQLILVSDDDDDDDFWYDSDDDDDDDIDDDSAIELYIKDSSRRNNLTEEERPNCFWKNLARNKAFQKLMRGSNLFICFHDLFLDDWEPLLTMLQQSEANIVKFKIVKEGSISERGALVLSNLLKNAKPMPLLNNNNDDDNKKNRSESATEGSFCIKKLHLEWLDGCMSWTDGLIQNKTITHLNFRKTFALSDAIRYIQNLSQLKEAKFYGSGTEVQGTSNRQQQQSKLTELDLETLYIEFQAEEEFSLDLCQDVGSTFRRAKHLKDLKLRNIRFETPYDILKHATNCQKIHLHSMDFDIDTLCCLIQGNVKKGAPGKLKDLQLTYPEDMSKIELFLQRVNLSLLDSFKIHVSEPFDDDIPIRFMDTLCRYQLAGNKGPKNLGLTLDDTSMELSDLATRIIPTLVGNDKIRRLEIKVEIFCDEFEPQEQLLDAMGKMPRLQSWSIDGFDDLDYDDTIDQWQVWVLRQLQSNPSIQEIDVPFDMNDNVEDLLVLNKYWHTLLCSHDQMSSGIWSPALSRIKTVNLMFRVVREIPSLFQELANAASQLEKYRSPSFVVPHSFNCPGCHKRRRKPHENS